MNWTVTRLSDNIWKVFFLFDFEDKRYKVTGDQYFVDII